jgi:hypothetical protein
MHRGQLVAFGNSNDPHRIYFSLDTDHEDFTTTGLQFSIFPGEGTRLFGAFEFKSRLFLMKEPRGVYWMEDSTTTTGNWYVVKGSSEFGIASPNAAQQALDDMLLKNTAGSITSIAASEAFGDIESGDFLDILKVERFVQLQTSNQGNADTSSLYDQYRKLLRFAYWGAGSSENNTILNLHFEGQNAMVSLSDKDQANVFALRREMGILKPYYGAEDGFIYQMDRTNRDIELIEQPGQASVALAGAGAGNVDDGEHFWAVTYYDGSNESDMGFPSLPLTVADQSSDGKVSLSSIPVDPRGLATQRRIYRTAVGSTLYKLVGVIADNTTTTFTDNVADANLGAQAPLINTFNTAYEAEFMLPHSDFSQADPRLASKNKILDMIEIFYYPTGNWTVSMDSFVDSSYQETLSFNPYFGETLDSVTVGTYRFLGETPRVIRKRLHGRGRTWSGRFFNSGLRENFRLAALRLHFRLGNEDMKEFLK